MPDPHDEMCFAYSTLEEVWMADRSECDCRIIALARSDEREKAVLRLLEVPAYDYASVDRVTSVEIWIPSGQAIQAVRGES